MLCCVCTLNGNIKDVQLSSIKHINILQLSYVTVKEKQVSLLLHKNIWNVLLLLVLLLVKYRIYQNIFQLTWFIHPPAPRYIFNFKEKKFFFLQFAMYARIFMYIPHIFIYERSQNTTTWVSYNMMMLNVRYT